MIEPLFEVVEPLFEVVEVVEPAKPSLVHGPFRRG